MVLGLAGKITLGLIAIGSVGISGTYAVRKFRTNSENQTDDSPKDQSNQGQSETDNTQNTLQSVTPSAT